MKIIISFSLLLSVFFISKQSMAANCAQLISVTGTVDILRLNQGSGDERSVAKYTLPADLSCTDVIVTRQGSRAKVKLPATIMTLSPNSRFFVSQISGKKNDSTIVNLTYGKMRSFFKSEKKSETGAGLKVKTPSAVAGVRGTDFYVSYEPNTQVTEQATLTGNVEVEQVGTKQKVEVASGQQVEVKNIEPLEVKPINLETVREIQQTSVLAKNEEVFSSKEAVQIVGTPEKWVAPAQEKVEIPSQFSGIENKF